VIETEHRLSTTVAIDTVWAYVADLRNWAALFPGSQGCEVIDTNDSRWTLKVGAGGLVKTVTVLVHVDAWDGPERVAFSYQLPGEPVTGSGRYSARRSAEGGTDIELAVRVEGSGPMAPMWEAVSRPLLPQLAKTFAAALVADIERQAGASPVRPPITQTQPAGIFARLLRWLAALWRPFGRSRNVKTGPNEETVR